MALKSIIHRMWWAGFLVSLSAILLGTASAGPPSKVPKPGATAPAFSGSTTEGALVDSRELIAGNRAVLVAFWGIRCSACIEEIPALKKIQDEFRSGTVRVIGVNTDGVDASALKAMMQDEKISMNYTVLADPDFKVADAYGMTAAPLTLLIDREGKVRYAHEDYKQGDEIALREKILEVIGQSH